VGITEAPQVMYHKIYALPDDLVENWTLLLTDLPTADIQVWKEKIQLDGAQINGWKAWLAGEIVRQYHGEAAAKDAAERESAVHRGDALPEDTPEFRPAADIANLLDLLVACNAVPSRGEGKKLLQNGGVQIDGEKASDPVQSLPETDFVLRAGKRKYWKILRS
jgi:tyrosyl-tRNA synthetase